MNEEEENTSRFHQKNFLATFSSHLETKKNVKIVLLTMKTNLRRSEMRKGNLISKVLTRGRGLRACSNKNIYTQCSLLNQVNHKSPVEGASRFQWNIANVIKKRLRHGCINLSPRYPHKYGKQNTHKNGRKRNRLRRKQRKKRRITFARYMTMKLNINPRMMISCYWT